MGLTATAAPARCPHARVGVAFYRGRYADHRAVRGLATPHPAGRKPQSCPDAHYLAEVWEARSYRARVVTEEWLLERRTLREQPHWIRAIEEVQKAYPGTEDWLRSCSASEGAGRNLSQNSWVRFGGEPYYAGYSGVGGWLQFLPGTFWRMFEAARADVEARGFILDPSAASWFSRLGQALAGAWGVTHGRRGEWAGAGC